MKYYLAIDVGTTNWKASVFDEAGTMLAIERTPTVTLSLIHISEPTRPY